MANLSWSNSEVELIVADYFDMLTDEINGLFYNKSKHRSSLIPLLNQRSEGSVELKHQNISAVMISLGFPFIVGYKPLINFQKSILPEVERVIQSNPSYSELFERFAFGDGLIVKTVGNFSALSLVDAPEKQITKKSINGIRIPRYVNFLEIEQNNRNLGLKGEELVFEYEKRILNTAGKNNLADRVEWVSRDEGDGHGYDILSKNLNGSDKYVEVKTTKLSKYSPFYFTSNERKFSNENEFNFHLFRVFEFGPESKLFILKGKYDSFCNVESSVFKGSF